jgi:hypothetical protein
MPISFAIEISRIGGDMAVIPVFEYSLYLLTILPRI